MRCHAADKDAFPRPRITRRAVLAVTALAAVLAPMFVAPAADVATAAPGCTVDRELAVGTTGGDVICLQEAINRDRAEDIAVDGTYGPATQSAVAGFQNAVGLPVTGRADAATLDRYGIWAGGSTAAPAPTTAPPTTTASLPPSIDDDCTVDRELAVGTTGGDVFCLQLAINRDRASDIAVDGVYGPATQSAVAGFQSAVGLPVTGRADAATLGRYGIWAGGSPPPPPATTPTTSPPTPSAGGDCTVSRTLSIGSSGQDVVCLQEAINRDRASDIVVDGQYGSQTASAVRGFQSAVGLPTTGTADQATLERYRIWGSSSSGGGGGSTPPPTSPPSSAIGDDCTVDRELAHGTTGGDVICLQLAINRDRASDIAVDGFYGDATADAVRGYQSAVGLPITGKADAATLDRYGIWSGPAPAPPPPTPPPPTVDCTVARTLYSGMSGQEVTCLQLAINRDRASDIAVDGHYGWITESAVRAFQGALGLSITGIADPATLQRYRIWSGPDPSTLPPPTNADLYGLPSNSGWGRRIVYDRGQQRLWAVDDSGNVVKTHRVSGRTYEPYAGTYYVYSRSEYTYSAKDPTVRWRYMVRFAYGPQGGRIGFHEIPNRYGVPLQTEEQLGLPLSGGCVRQTTSDAIWLWNWAPIGTKVVVL